MDDGDNLRVEVERLTQQLLVEATRVRSAFVALRRMHRTDVEALAYVLLAQDRGAPITAGALAVELGLTTGAVTAVVNRLERAGQLARARHEHDRRKVLLECTQAGRELAAAYAEPVRQRTQAVMDHFSRAELEVVGRYLAASAAAMSEHRDFLADTRTRAQNADEESEMASR